MSEEVFEPQVPLTVFCERLSARDRRVELVSAFFAWAGQQPELTQATEARFENAFQQFCNQPA